MEEEVSGVHNKYEMPLVAKGKSDPIPNERSKN
jgi:hypothetical protein